MSLLNGEKVNDIWINTLGEDGDFLNRLLRVEAAVAWIVDGYTSVVKNGEFTPNPVEEMTFAVMALKNRWVEIIESWNYTDEEKSAMYEELDSYISLQVNNTKLWVKKLMDFGKVPPLHNENIFMADLESQTLKTCSYKSSSSWSRQPAACSSAINALNKMYGNTSWQNR